MIDVSTKELRSNFYSSSEWKQKRSEILLRDNFECLFCKEDGRATTEQHSILEVDHIKELKDHPELALDDENLRTLCKNCHNKRHKRFNFREKRKINKWANDERWD